MPQLLVYLQTISRRPAQAGAKLKKTKTTSKSARSLDEGGSRGGSRGGDLLSAIKASQARRGLG